MLKINLFLLAFFVNNCSTFFGSQPAEVASLGASQKEDPSKPMDSFEEKDLSELDEKSDGKSKSNLGSLELRQARLWARLDELEGGLLLQKEKLHILEKSLLLGIKPEDTTQKSVFEKREKIHAALNPLRKKTQLEEPIFKKKVIKNSNLPIVTEEEHEKEKIADIYKRHLNEAKKLFKEGRFGKAYLEFSKLEREFDLQLNAGEPSYWLGRCWYKLQEHSQAKQYFTTFISKHQSSPLLASAKYYLAKTKISLGLRDAAVRQLEGLIKEHPYEGSAEAAKQLLQNITDTL